MPGRCTQSPLSAERSTQTPLAKRIIAWHKRHGRSDLPWQKNPTPYRVWVSEIMLQQTQVKTVIPYYQTFLKRFPNAQQLANAELDEVLSLWTGLGYYARARSLHKAAGIVQGKHKGRIPRHKDALVALPGIGTSTAGAILSLAHDQAHAVLDANVRRVLARHADIKGWHQESKTQKKLWHIAEQHLPEKNAGTYNQGMMDLGALVCTATQPLCAQCPVQIDCKAYHNNTIAQRPTRRPTQRRKRRNFSVVIVQYQDSVLLEKRPAKGVWGGLLSFPEATDISRAKAWCTRRFGRHIDYQEWQGIRYNLTHIEMQITPLRTILKSRPRQLAEAEHYIWCKIDHLPGGTSSLVKRLLAKTQTTKTI